MRHRDIFQLRTVYLFFLKMFLTFSMYFKQKLELFLTLTKWFLCLNLTRQ